jgi:hypothetical protein
VKTFQSVFKTPGGKEVLKALEDEFDAMDIRDDNPHNTYYKLGQRDVVVYIKQMLEAAENIDE